MNVLQVAPFSAYPPNSGGKHRVHGLMMGRGKKDDVIRFAVVDFGGSEIVDVSSDYREHRFASYRTSIVGFLGGQFDAGQTLASTGLRLTRPEQLSGYIDAADVIIVEFPWQVPYVDSIRPSGTPLVYSSHNFEGEEYAFLNDSCLTKPLYDRARRIERHAIERADLVVVTGERDERLYREEFGVTGPFHIAPNGASLTAIADTEREKSDDGFDAQSEYVALFAGSSHTPNVEAVEQILDVAHDERVREYPVQFRVVGTICDAFSDIDPPENVEFLGFVDNLGAQYRAADIGLNPALSGGGSNVKVPEYFAHGLAVVTTEYGLRGVPAEPDRHCVVAADRSFVDATLSLLDAGRPEIERLGDEARKLASERLNWENISATLFERLRRLAD
jgi:glycosyltransferase involved in cell wall biosynthesis